MRNCKIYSIDEIKRRFRKVARKYEINEAYVFGSYARGDATDKSDVDILIKADKIKDLFQLGGFYVDAKEAFKKEVDVVTTEALLKKRFEDEMKKDLVKIYG